VIKPRKMGSGAARYKRLTPEGNPPPGGDENRYAGLPHIRSAQDMR